MASAAGTRAFLVCGIAGFCVALALVRAQPGPAQRDGSAKTGPSVTVPAEVRDLWREYPLNPPAPPPAQPQPTRDQRTSEGSPSADADGESPAIPSVLAVAAGAAAVGLVALVLAVGLRLASARRKRTMDDRPRERLDVTAEAPTSEAEDVQASDAEALSAEAKADKLELRSAEAEERSDAVTIATPETPDEGGDQNESYAQVGEQVATVLAAAHQAAEEIRSNALEEANRIRDEAKSEAASTRDEADKAVVEARRESDALRAEAEQYARETREAADHYVATTRQHVEDDLAQKRAEIDQAARDSHRAAEERAREIETEALERRTAIIDAARRSEARLQQLLGVYRGMTAQLEELVQAERAVDDAAGADGQDESRVEELSDDLRPRRPQTEAAGESGSPA